MLDLSLTIHGHETLDKSLTALLSSATAEALRHAGERLRGAGTMQFATEGSAFGTPWTPRKHFDPFRGTLVKTGRLRASLTMLGVEHIEEIQDSPPMLIFGTKVPYALPLHAGTSRLPPRPILTEEMLS